MRIAYQPNAATPIPVTATKTGQNGNFSTCSTVPDISVNRTHRNQEYYYAPARNWDYDLDFNDAANLSPLTPRFIYLRQQLFKRNYN